MKTLLLQIKNSIATVSLNRPNVHNAFNEDLMNELQTVFTDLQKKDDVRLVILQGEGKSFCAGADLNYMKSAAQKSHQQNVEESLKMAKMFSLINELAKPVIGLIHGAVFGGGVGLVSVCDIVLCHTDAKFSLSEVKLGLNPSVISPFVVAKIGLNRSRRFFITGERFTAQKAHAIGLVNEVYSSEEQKQDILSGLIKNILANGPHAMAQAKKLVQKNRDLTGQDLVNFTAEQIADLRKGPEAQEGMQAFLEKRPASYVVKP